MYVIKGLFRCELFVPALSEVSDVTNELSLPTPLFQKHSDNS